MTDAVIVDIVRTPSGKGKPGGALHPVHPVDLFAGVISALIERNEALDCRVYARAAAWIAGADRWPDEKWRDLEDQLGAAPTDTDPAGQINRPGQAPQGKRRSDWLGRRGGWF